MRPSPNALPTPRTLGSPRIWLLVILILGAGLRFFALDSKSLWVDEMYSLASSTGHYPNMDPLRFDEIMPSSPRLASLAEARPWWTIWPNMREGTHPPLYIILLRFWRELFGESPFALRSLSAAASLVAVVLLWDVARHLLDPVSALFAAGVIAMAGPQIRFAQDARPYALLMALGMGALDAVVRIEKQGPGVLRLIALAICMLGMALTHYFAFGALVGIGLYVLIRFRGRMLVLTLIAMAAMAVAFLILWGPALWHQRHNTTFAFLIESSDHPRLAALRRFDALPARLLIDWDGSLILLGGGITLLALVGWLAWRRRELLLPLLWFIATAGFVAGLDFGRGTRHLEWIRYPLLASAGLYLLIAGVGRVHRGLYAVPAVVALGCAMALPLYYGDPNPEWRRAAEHLQTHAAPDELVVFAGREDWLPPAEAIGFAYYAHEPRRPILVLTHPPTLQLLTQLRQRKRIWVVADERPEALIPGCRAGDVYFPFVNSAVFEVTFPASK